MTGVADGPGVARSRSVAGVNAARGGSGRLPADGSRRSWVDVDVSDTDVARVAVHGDLDVDTSGPVVDTVLTALPGLRQTRVEVDMSEAGFVDSTGLGSLVRLRVEARRHGAHLSLVGLDPRLAKLLRLTGLDQDLTPS